MYFVSPNAGELYYLRMLLTNVRGAHSFDGLRTVTNGEACTVHDTFKEACIALGILANDGELEKCLQEAVVMQTGNQLRKLFCIILSECNPTKPELLWEKYGMNICDDLQHRLRSMFNIPNPTDEHAMDYGLYILDQLLRQSGKKLENYKSMPRPRHDWGQIVVRESVLNTDIERLNVEQRTTYNSIVDSVNNRDGRMFFLNGSAGTGKTFLYNTIARSCRRDGNIVLTVASSGIASLLLDGGRTAHSTFKIPFNVQEDSNIGISKDSEYAQLLKEVRFVIWDEVSMQHRFCMEAVDRLLRDIRSDDRHFGGVTVVLGGDFRQTLPVVSNAGREQTVGASIRSSFLWDYINVLTLNQNMRLEQQPENLGFANFLLEIGTNPKEVVNLPSTMNKCQNMHEMISSVYPLLGKDGPMSTEHLTERIILSPRNEDVHKINLEALGNLQGEAYTYLAVDKMIRDDHGRDSRFTTEFLNNLNPPGSPPFKLDIKVGCPVMLLRNLAPKEGLCNGTRLVVTRCRRYVIEAKIITGEKAGEIIFIPRITFQPSPSELDIQMERRQFPIHVAYAMTINKSQGQSVKYVDIDLCTPVFSHGQLYVALSRCTAARRITLLMPNESNECFNLETKNVVYPEILL
ncbi:ATP-dependent DNA helicase PIF7-like [Papaver somniferum]|uniref:ATP-dependent DNA helicase PIF7-like n=1 Tax=Papaver somniferum TaxID=3469 RepID=UPI000E6FDA67|nr:ATP-dependent DNA helicase PIF7-like [Papaver somniferum]